MKPTLPDLLPPVQGAHRFRAQLRRQRLVFLDADAHVAHQWVSAQPAIHQSVGIGGVSRARAEDPHRANVGVESGAIGMYKEIPAGLKQRPIPYTSPSPVLIMTIEYEASPVTSSKQQMRSQLRRYGQTSARLPICLLM
jgi:hypothetical protein